MQKKLIGNRYRIKGLIGEGGMASVYAALDEKLDRRVAIKILHQHLARNSDIRERFLLEAKTVSTFEHPNIIKVYDFSGLDSEQLWMVTEILYGVDLAEYVKRFPENRLHPVVATLITREISQALHEVHKLDIVHRDIKPENIMMLDNGQVKLMDFGIAKVHRANATMTGTFMGSPSYMSPEQIRGSDVDLRADIYSLCVLFYEIVTGVLPYGGQTTAEVINKIMVGRYTSPKLLLPDLPVALSESMSKGLRSSKEERFQAIIELVEILDKFLSDYGFGDSRLELEQYTKNRLVFDERLARYNLPKTTQPRLPKDLNNIGQESSTRSIQKQTMSPDQQTTINQPAKRSRIKSRSGPKPRPGTAYESTSPIAEVRKTEVQKSATIAPSQNLNTPGRTQAPRSDGSGRSSNEAAKNPNRPSQKTVYPSAAKAPEQAQSRDMGSEPTSGAGKQGVFRRPIRRVARRDVSGLIGKRPRRVFDPSNYLLFGLLAAIALVFIFGGDKFSKPGKRDLAKVVAPIDTGKKPKTTRDSKEEAVADLAKPELVQKPANSLSDATNGGGANISRSSVNSPDRDQASPRPSKPVVTINKTLVPNSSNRNKIAQTSPRENLRNRDPQAASANNDGRAVVLASVSERNQQPSDRLPAEPPKRNEPGMLKVAASPAAEIFIDGRLFGTTNDSDIADGIKLDPGSYSLRLKRRGHKTEEQQVNIKGGETRQLNVSLSKAVELLELNIRSNRFPANLVIEDMKDGGRRKEMKLLRSSLTVNLKPSTYRVTVSFENNDINRVIDLNESEGSKTFNADFR